jgi:hypothetical protein
MIKNAKPTLAQTNRTIARQWHPTKNAPLTPSDVTYGSHKKVWWVCDKGHEWQAPVYNRSDGHGCPCCTGRKAAKDTCLQTVNSRLAREWHPTRNAPLTPKDVSYGSSSRKMWWICKEGHEWEADVSARARGNGCPYCSGHKLCEDNCLQAVNPKLAREWHPTRNAPLTPKDVMPGTTRKAWWLCRKGHEWEAVINSRNGSGAGCPYCAGHKANRDNCLQTVNSELAGEWHPTKNAPLTPNDVTDGSNKKVWWLCRKGHEWQAHINIRNRIGSGCPYCARKKACKDNCLQTDNPKLAREWHPTKNAPLTAKDVISGSDKKAWWMCRRGHEWQAAILSRKQGSGCPYCSGRRATREMCLVTVSPILAEEWHPTKNSWRSPGNVAPCSRRQAWWKCKMGHEWLEPVIDRYKRGGCPVCVLKKRAPRLFERGACRS